MWLICSMSDALRFTERLPVDRRFHASSGFQDAAVAPIAVNSNAVAYSVAASNVR